MNNDNDCNDKMGNNTRRHIHQELQPVTFPIALHIQCALLSAIIFPAFLKSAFIFRVMVMAVCHLKFSYLAELN